MNKQSATYIILIVLVAVIAGNYWPSTELNVEAAKLPSSADYFIKKVNIKQFANDGHLINQLNADKLEHFKDQQTSEILAPQIIITPTDGATWKISASQGKLDHTSQLIELNRSVILEQKQKTNNDNSNDKISDNLKAKASIETQHLIFNLSNNTARTQVPVIISTENSTTKALEMIADFKNNVINLDGHTETEGTSNGVQ